ncbi:MAG: VWA domain-containing protein [Anaerolineales bacterium]|nr:VWA domain-containing protein [Anaerolineales bacterium]
MMKIKHLLFVILILLALWLAACGGANETAENAPSANDVMENTAEEPPMSVGSERTGGELPSPPAEGEKVETERLVLEEVAVADADTIASAPMAASMPMATGSSEERAGEMPVMAELSGVDASVQENSQLTAGEVDDNDQWDDYLLYLREYSGAAVMHVDVSERHQIRVQDAQGNPVLAAQIDIAVNEQTVQTLRTHSDGRSYFFPRALDLTAQEYVVHVTVNDAVESFTIPANSSQREWIVTVPEAQQVLPRVRLDVLFLIDATGSMSDEINQLKENIRAIAAQIDALPSKPDVRYGMVTYRDQGDAYVTQVYDFTPDVELFAQDLAGVFAEGGGDYPEDLNEALYQAIHTPEWRVEETVSLIFLVADAPPHLDYGQQNHYAVEMVNAATRGIKIYPIASSGLDSQGEYIFRQLAQFTGGRFIFLTYGAEGPGSTGTETEFEVDDYTVGALDTLVIRVITEELSFLVR